MPDSDDEIGDVHGDNMLPTLLLESIGSSWTVTMLGVCDLIFDSSNKLSFSSLKSLSKMPGKSKVI